MASYPSSSRRSTQPEAINRKNQKSAAIPVITIAYAEEFPSILDLLVFARLTSLSAGHALSPAIFLVISTEPNGFGLPPRAVSWSCYLPEMFKREEIALDFWPPLACRTCGWVKGANAQSVRGNGKKAGMEHILSCIPLIDSH